MSTSRYDLFTGYEDSNIPQVNNYFTRRRFNISRGIPKKKMEKNPNGNSFKPFFPIYADSAETISWLA